jgi:hypothetical protein
VAFAFPDYSKEFEFYTDASSKQMCAVITQGNMLIAFSSRKTLWNTAKNQCNQK